MSICRVTNSSLASQAVGPATSNFEMSFENRTFPDVGKKLLAARPLAKQKVHPDDSVLGPLSNAGQRNANQPGLNAATYADMVRAAFQDSWWNSREIIQREPNSAEVQAASTNNPRTVARTHGRGYSMRSGAPDPDKLGPDQFTQAQWNFSMFWGLAIQAYEATLIADDTPYDRYEGSQTKGLKGDPNALTAGQRNGLTIFTDADPNRGARCNNCHSLPVTTNHSVADIVQSDLNTPNFQGRPVDIIEFMTMGDGASANYDKGFYNIGVRRSSEDAGRDDTAPASTPANPQRPSRTRSMNERSRFTAWRWGIWRYSTNCPTTFCGSCNWIR
jgi:cytochrome c peroxidase